MSSYLLALKKEIQKAEDQLVNKYFCHFFYFGPYFTTKLDYTLFFKKKHLTTFPPNECIWKEYKANVNYLLHNPFVTYTFYIILWDTHAGKYKIIKMEISLILAIKQGWCKAHCSFIENQKPNLLMY